MRRRYLWVQPRPLDSIPWMTVSQGPRFATLFYWIRIPWSRDCRNYVKMTLDYRRNR